jgi:uncharacterized protein YerC
MRVSSRKLNPSLKKQIKSSFAQVLADIKDTTEMDKFLADYLSDSEYEILAKRLAVAYWLRKGRSYENIKKNLKVSSATVASVQSEIKKPSLQKGLKILEAEEWANIWADRIKKFIS